MRLSNRCIVLALPIVLLSCNTQDGTGDPSKLVGLQDKYADFPYVESEGSAIPQPTLLPFGRPQVEVIAVPGEYGRVFRFSKLANRRYRVSLTQLTGDLDVFGHWTPKVDRYHRHEEHVSYNYNTANEEFFIDSTKDGEYFIRVQAFNRGSGGQGVLLLEDVTPGVQRPEKRRARIFSVSGHNMDSDGLLGICENNPEYLRARNTIGTVKQVIERSGRYSGVSATYYSDNFFDVTTRGRTLEPNDPLNQDEQRLSLGFLHLYQDLNSVAEQPQASRPEIFLIAHSHGTVWSHIAASLFEDRLDIKVLIDLDGESFAWSRPVGNTGDCWVNTINDYMRDEQPDWALEPSDLVQVFGADIEDLVPDNVEHNIEIAADAVWIQDSEPNRRSDNSTRGIYRFEIEDENHSEVTYPGSEGMNVVIRELERILS